MDVDPLAILSAILFHPLESLLWSPAKHITNSSPFLSAIAICTLYACLFTNLLNFYSDADMSNCGICWDTKPATGLAIAACGHPYCRSCLDRHLARGNRHCPCCRQTLLPSGQSTVDVRWRDGSQVFVAVLMLNTVATPALLGLKSGELSSGFIVLLFGIWIVHLWFLHRF
jgi:hypothetical protein